MKKLSNFISERSRAPDVPGEELPLPGADRPLSLCPPPAHRHGPDTRHRPVSLTGRHTGAKGNSSRFQPAVRGALSTNRACFTNVELLQYQSVSMNENPGGQGGGEGVARGPLEKRNRTSEHNPTLVSAENAQ